MKALKEFDNLDKTLLAGLEAVKSFKHWISAGTALGLYRDKDFIPTDTDIDVEVLCDWDNYQAIDSIPGFTRLQFFDHEGRPMQRAFTHDFNGAIFDIYYFYRGVEEGMAVNFNHYGQMKVPLHFFENVKELPTKYGDLPFPHPIEDYLLVRYGQNWRTPSNKKGLYKNDF